MHILVKINHAFSIQILRGFFSLIRIVDNFLIIIPGNSITYLLWLCVQVKNVFFVQYLVKIVSLSRYTVKNYSVFYSVLLLNCYNERLFPQFTVNCCYFFTFIFVIIILYFLQCKM